MSNELSPCPFCGESDAYPVHQIGAKWNVFCGNCGVETNLSDGKGLAIAHWNRRAQLKPLTNEQVKAIHRELCNTEGSCYMTVARAIEAAHGITGATDA